MANEIAQFREQLTKMAPEIARVLPDHVTPERFERVTLSALQRSPDLLECDRRSLFSAVMSCAQDGLQPDGREAALVKFGGRSNAAAYMPMVSGLLKLARQSGEIASLTAQVVYDEDTFDYWIDDQGEHLMHRPVLMRTRDRVIGVYAMARTRDGEAIIEVMPVAEVEKVRSASRAAQGGPWSQWWSEMARKTAIRRLFKRLPRSTDRLEQAVHRDDQFYSMERPVNEPAPRGGGGAEAALRNLGQDMSGSGDDPEPPPNGGGQPAGAGNGSAGEQTAPTGAVKPGTPDHHGTPYDPRIHAASATQTKDGGWRRRRGVSDEYFEEVTAELLGWKGSGEDATAAPQGDPDGTSPDGGGSPGSPDNADTGAQGGESAGDSGGFDLEAPGETDWVSDTITRMEGAQERDTLDEIADEALNGTEIDDDQRQRLLSAHKRNSERLGMFSGD